MRKTSIPPPPPVQPSILRSWFYVAGNERERYLVDISVIVTRLNPAQSKVVSITSGRDRKRTDGERL